MSTINTHYTFNYSQPAEYKLSHDSVFLAREVFERTENLNFEEFRILDVCAGSGIVGMDLLFHRRTKSLTQPRAIDFIEVQNIYHEHFIENCKRLGAVSSELNFVNHNYNLLQNSEFQAKYDLIIGNPPYFEQSQGKLSPSEFKNRCRFFIDSDLTNLLQGISHSLKKNAQAFLLLRNRLEHGVDIIAQVREMTSKELRTDIIRDIRGTHLVRFTRL